MFLLRDDMPDITMCKNEDCPSSYRCFRFLARPDKYMQTYGIFKPKDDQVSCVMFWDIRGKKDGMAIKRKRVGRDIKSGTNS